MFFIAIDYTKFIKNIVAMPWGVRATAATGFFPFIDETNSIIFSRYSDADIAHIASSR